MGKKHGKRFGGVSVCNLMACINFMFSGSHFFLRLSLKSCVTLMLNTYTKEPGTLGHCLGAHLLSACVRSEALDESDKKFKSLGSETTQSDL